MFISISPLEGLVVFQSLSYFLKYPVDMISCSRYIIGILDMEVS